MNSRNNLVSVSYFSTILPTTSPIETIPNNWLFFLTVEIVSERAFFENNPKSTSKILRQIFGKPKLLQGSMKTVFPSFFLRNSLLE